MMVLVPALLCLSQTPNLSTRIDRYVTQAAANREFSGVVIVNQKGKAIYRKAHGLANADWNVKNRPDSVFRIASLSKTFTAGAIYRLEKLGRLSFDDSLAKYLPKFPRASEITIRQLLNHSSGVGEPEMEPLLHRDTNLSEVIDRIASTPFQHEPGKQSGYSNSGYSLLAAVVEKAGEDDYENFLRKSFFIPLKMNRTGNFRQEDFVSYRASPYRPGPPPYGVLPVPGFDETAYLGAGALCSTADDLAKWLEAIRTNQFFDIDRLNWPMGWGKRTYFDRRANEQTGISNGFTAAMITFPAESLDIVILTNLQTQFASRAIVELAGMVFGVDPKPRLAKKAVDISQVKLSEIAGSYRAEGMPVMAIQLRKGALFYQWAGSSEFRYLMPVASMQLYAPDEDAVWTWKDSSGFQWDGPFGTLKFEKVPKESKSPKSESKLSK